MTARFSIVLLLAIALLLPNLAAADMMSALRRAIRVGAEVTDDIPPRALKPASGRLDTIPAPGVRRLDPDLARATIRSLDADLLRQIDELPAVEWRFALEVFEGGRVLRATNPDELARARLISEGGTDLLVAAQRHGDEAARPAFMLQMAEGAGQVPAGSVSRFSQMAAERGTPFLSGWNRYILPNWKALAGAGAITTCLAASESCIDAAGNLSAHMAETVAGLGVEVAGGIVRGGAEGAGEAVAKQVRGPNGAWFIAGSLGLILALWLLRRLPRGAGWLLRRALSAARPSASPSPDATPVSKARPPTNRPRPSLRDRDI